MLEVWIMKNRSQVSRAHVTPCTRTRTADELSQILTPIKMRIAEHTGYEVERQSIDLLHGWRLAASPGASTRLRRF